MAVEDYYVSSARIANDLVKYGLYPAAKMLAMMTTHDSHKANVIAGVTATTFYSGLSWVFLGSEMDGFDSVARKAVAAELGKKPEELKFSDFYESDNRVVKKRMEIFGQENRTRYGISVLPMLPTAMEIVARRVSPGSMRPEHRDLVEGETRWRDKRPAPNAPAIEHFLDGWNLWDMVVYSGISALWFSETYGIPKTFAYQSRKEMENNQSLGLKIGPNNIAGLYNRMRTDANLPMVDTKEDREKIWPLYEELAKKANASSKFDLPEMAYLMGTGKLDVFAKDQSGKEIHGPDGFLVLDEKAMQRAYSEIAHVEKIGLDGIAKENREKRLATGKTEQEKPSFVSKLGRDWIDFQFSGYRSMFGKTKKFQESISSRDPSEVPYTPS